MCSFYIHGFMSYKAVTFNNESRWIEKIEIRIKITIEENEAFLELLLKFWLKLYNVKKSHYNGWIDWR